MQLISEQGSERATNDSGKIITHDGQTHVIWQDVTRDGYFNRIRSLDHTTGLWSPPVTLDQGIDNHARGVMTIDPQGFIHVILGGHGSAVSWCRSLLPNDSSGWTQPQPIGTGTYPILLCDPEGTLLLTLRGQGDQRHQRGLDLYRCEAGGEWEAPRRIVKLAEEYGQAYAGFHTQMDIGPDGVLHAIIDFYEGEDEHGRGLHQAVCYACSRDGGIHWQKADGSSIQLPARPEDLDTLARNAFSRHEPLPPPEIKHGGIVVSASGRPFFFYLHHTLAPGHVSFGTVDEEGVIREQVVSHHWEAEWPNMRALGCWSSIRADDTIFALVLLAPLNEEWIDGRPTRAMNLGERSDQRLIWLTTKDGGASFDVSSFFEPGSSCNCPSLERPAGANTVPADRRPQVLYFDGTNEYPGGGDYYAEDRTISQILASGGFRANHVWLT